MFSLPSAGIERLSTQFVDQALTSGEFLEYDLERQSYQSSAINDALIILRDNVDRLKYVVQSSKEALAAFVATYSDASTAEEDVSVKNQDLLPPLGIAACQQNIVNLSVALLKALDGDNSRLLNLKLNPTSPLASEAEKIGHETPTSEAV